MDKRTLLAVALSTLVIVGFYTVQAIFFPPVRSTAPVPAPVPVETTNGLPPYESAPLTTTEPDGGGGGIGITDTADLETEIPAETVTIETGLFIATLTNDGGDITSFRLKKHEDGAENVDMIFSGAPDGGSTPHAFTVALGPWTNPALTSRFHVRRTGDLSVEFSRSFKTGNSGRAFTLTKTYTFVQNEYMFELGLTIDGGGVVPEINAGGAAYTIGFGPQIGPRFAKLDEQQNYRRFFSFINGKLRQEKVGASSPAEIDGRFTWTALAGKYFAFIAVPDAANWTAVFSQKPAETGVPTASRLYLTRPPLEASRVSDKLRFYLGPKTQDALGIYDNARNAYKYTDLQISKLGATSGFWSILNPLEWLLKQMLTFFNGVFHNYGVAIILVTLLVKVLLFPLTKKSSEATLRMQAFAPKIKELQEKYKGNPQKLNVEMANFYKKEGYNPLSGCLPMLLQIPIFFAMYNLFNNHFDLRGAMFIPGWIPDLSLPETIWNFAPARIPLLGWSDIRILPFVYVGSQLLYGRITQTPDQANSSQMKMMLYVMPVMFFFILYNVPSGLLVYWIMSNLLTLAQQYGLNKYLKQKRAALGIAQSEPAQAVLPPRKRRKKR